MIVYQATKAGFSDDVLNDQIENKIHTYFKQNLNRSTGNPEIRSWKNSMHYMDRVLNDPSIPDDCGISIEFQIPQTSNRIDFILTGKGEQDKEYAVIVELKQWSEATLSDKDAVVNSFVGGKVRECTYPSYQAWSYAALLESFNETVEQDGIELRPCAYLHNYVADDVISHRNYKKHIEKAPMFLKGEAVKLRDFIKQFVKYGDDCKIMYRIDRGRIRPSKMLSDSMVGMLNGNTEFIMIDDQKVIYETALQVSAKANINRKEILIVKGGPGTGKSVVAINLLVELTNRGLLAKYVSKNAAPRAVYESKLTGTIKKTVISNLFGGSGAFINTKSKQFDVLVVDEAHRLNEKSGLYGTDGLNQVKEIIDAAQSSVFFLDEDQRIHLKDIGSVNEIRHWASLVGANVQEMELSSQFRCSGSDAYIAWLDNTLQVRETANETLAATNYEFKVFDSPNELRTAIQEKNEVNNKARMVAGYCWDWKSDKNPAVNDVVIAEHNFGMKWNLKTDGSLWIIKPESVNEVGCIHTCQGLEVDYIGVIIGEDLVVRDGKVITNPYKRSKNDSSVRGYKKLLKQDPIEGGKLLDLIIKNTYRTLMTRGMKGCYIYCVDPETAEFFRAKVSL
ncbi:DUF2075 domain-containing protein [Pedobacter sp. Leaf250]|uniref:DUF2075 domain-containing protein n=1 Tax=Pedobacter sp. Leaf250 TaxID=2876559 RepID=UPI001E40189A|nr:DUF2075 domain-containing protein [Pedobacter sp. Leaf250]